MTILLLNDYGVLAGVSEGILLSFLHALRRCGHEARLFASTAAVAGLPNLADARGYGTTVSLRPPSRTG